MAELLLADYLQVLTHKLLPLLIYACVLQRSNLSFIKQISIFLSDCVFASFQGFTPRVCVTYLVRCPALSSGGSLLFRHGRGGGCACAAFPATGAAIPPGAPRYRQRPPRGNTAPPGYAGRLT